MEITRQRPREAINLRAACGLNQAWRDKAHLLVTLKAAALILAIRKRRDNRLLR